MLCTGNGVKLKGQKTKTIGYNVSAIIVHDKNFFFGKVDVVIGIQQYCDDFKIYRN